MLRETRGTLAIPGFVSCPWGVVDDLPRGRADDRKRSDNPKLGTTYLDPGFTALHESVRASCHLRRAQRNAGLYLALGAQISWKQDFPSADDRPCAWQGLPLEIRPEGVLPLSTTVVDHRFPTVSRTGP